MELINNFANLSKNLSAKFPDLDEFYLSVQILGYIAGFDKHYIFVSASSKPIVSLINFDKEIIQTIKELLLFSIEQPSENEKKDLCKFFLKTCLEYERQIKNPPDNPVAFLDNLISIEPQAVSKNNEWYNVNFSALSTESQKKYLDWDIERYYFYKSPLIPQVVNEKLVALANPKNGQSIYDPNCNVGSIFVEFYKKFPDLELSFRGTVRNQYEWLFCIVNLYINGLLDDKRIEVEIEVSSPFEDVTQKHYEMKNGDTYLREELADISVSVVPFEKKFSEDELDSRFFGLSYNLKKPEYAYTELMLNAVHIEGKAIIVVPDSILYSSEDRFFIETYLSRDWIESVISLPKYNFKSKQFIKTSIIIFNKNKSDKGFIVFDGNEDDFKKTRVSINLIKSKNNSDLRASRYALKESQELKSILSKYPQDEVKKINDLIDSSISGFNYSPKNRIAENSSETLPYVRVKDLSNNDKDFTLDISKVERKISLEKVTHKRTIIAFSAVLISKIAPKLKPTYFNFTRHRIVIGSDVVALKLKEVVDVEYFINQLNSRLVRLQVERASSGISINRITTQDFLDINIILPPLDEQKREVSRIGGVLAEKALVEEKLIDAQFDIVASINHSLKNKLAVIVNDYDSLVRFLRRKERNNGTINFADPISVNAVGDDIDTIEIITTRLKNNLSNASKVFNNALKIQRQNLKKDFIELVDFFKNEVKPLYAGKNYSIDIVAKPKLKLNVWLDKDAFKDVIENLIDNAKSHGFIDESKNYRIVFDLSKLENEEDIDDTSTQYARILYKNDGKPFPKDFSFEEYKQYLSKAGKTQGTGFGGYAVNKLIELHDGRFNFITPSDDFTVEFEILLPLEN